MKNINRRNFLKSTAAATAGAFMASPVLAGNANADAPWGISLAEWSFHRTIFDGDMTNLDFPVKARELGIRDVEYVNQFFMDKAKDKSYLAELLKICQNEDVNNLLIMCDREGMVGNPDKQERIQTVENHKKWIDAAAYLGCHSIRVNAASRGSYEEQQKLAADGLSRLADYGKTKDIHILVENHGGLSSNAEWLVGVMEMVDDEYVGTLPDFGNFVINRETGEEYDRYKGVKLLMPYAKDVSAKSHAFNKKGEETQSDYLRLMKIVKDSGYRGFVGIEYEGSELPEEDGVIATKRLLLDVFDKLS